MYDYFDIYGERAKGMEPTEDLEEAVGNADKFGLIVYDTDNKMDVYDIRKEAKWNPKWLTEVIGKRQKQK